MAFLLFCGTSQSVSFTLRFSFFPQGWPRNRLKMHLWLQKPRVSSRQAFCSLLCTDLCCCIRHTAVGSPHKDAVSSCHPWRVSWSPSGIRDSWPGRRDRVRRKAMESKAGFIHRTEEARAMAVSHLAGCCTVSHKAGVLWEQLWTPTETGSPLSTDLSFLIH